MSFLRDIWTDLVEKRLWPVAVLLVVAMVAAPVVLAGGSDAAAPVPPAPATPAPGAPTATAASAGVPVSLDQAPAQPAPQGGYKDPFAGAAKAVAEQSEVPSAPSASVPSAEPTAPSGAGGGVGASAGSSLAPTVDPVRTAVVETVDTTPADTTADDTPATGHFAGYRVDVHWGRAGSTKRMRDVVRLGRLDAGDEPLLVYFGVRREGDRALFLLTTDAAAVGDGRCMPAAKSCQVVEMRAGESEFFDVEGPGGAIAQYELDVDRIVKRYEDTGAKAEETLDEESKAGRKVMYEAIESGRDYSSSFMYRSSLGVVLRNVKATTSWYEQATNAEVGKTAAE